MILSFVSRMENAKIYATMRSWRAKKHNNLETKQQKKRDRTMKKIYDRTMRHIRKVWKYHIVKDNATKKPANVEKKQQTSYEVVIAVAKPCYSHVDYANTTVLPCDCDCVCVLWLSVFFLLRLGYFILRYHTSNEKRNTHSISCINIWKNNDKLKLPILLFERKDSFTFRARRFYVCKITVLSFLGRLK